MAISITPKTLATGTNNPNKQVSKNVWNAGHQLTAAPDVLIGTDGSGDGAEFGIGLGPGEIPTSDDLAAAEGSSAVGFIQNGTGAAARTAQAKLRDLASEADYSTLANYKAATAALTNRVGVNELDIGNPAAFGYADDDTARIYRDAGAPVSIQHTFRVITSSKGDNATYRGATNAYFEWRDRDDVDATNKGVGYALHLSVVPRVERNNVPYDDVACLTMGNTSGTVTAKATDCVYVSENPLFSALGNAEFYSLFTADCYVDVGYQLRFRPKTGKVARFPNDSYIYFNTATDASLGSDRLGIGLATDGALVIGDFASPRVDVRPPINLVQGGVVDGVLNFNGAAAALNLSAGYLARKAPVVVNSGTYTVLHADSYLIINTACTVTLPSPGSFPGREIILKTTGNTVTSASANVAPLAGGAAGTAILPSIGGKWVKLVSDGAVWHAMEGNV